MNNPQPTRIPRAALAIEGARAARARVRFVQVMARQLHLIARGTIRVHTVPTTHHGRATRAVILYSAAGVLPTTAEQRAAAYGLLTRAFPEADWSRGHTYDATTGELIVDEPTAPAELGLDTPGEHRQ